MTFILYSIVGAIAGVLAGLFGIGGGLIVVPALIFSFTLQQVAPDVLTHLAVGTSLASMVITSISSIRTHNKSGAVQWRIFLFVSCGLLLGSYLGAYTAASLSGSVLQKCLGGFALAVSAKMWFSLKASEGAKVPNVGVLATAGVIIGSISSLFGIGGGSISVPFFRHISLTMKQSVGTSAACGLPIALTGAISNMYLGYGHARLPPMSTGYVYWPAFFGIVITSVFFARIGARLAHRLPSDKLQKGFAVFLAIIGIQFLVGS